MFLKENRAILKQKTNKHLKSSFELKKLTRGIQRMLLTSTLFVIGGTLLCPQAEAAGVWQGTLSDDWASPGNWDAGGVPLPTTDVIIDTDGAPNAPRIVAGDAAAHAASIGDQAGATGVLTVDGVGAIWNQVDILYVGNLGTGTVNMTGGGMVATGGVAYVGYETGAVGTVLVDGAGARWSIGANSYIGEKGTGTVTLDHSAELITGAFITIGSQAGSNGKVLVQNVATMTSVGPLVVGKSGQGELTVSTGARVSNGGITIADVSGSKGVVNIGAASTDAAQAVGILNVPTVSFGSGDGQLVFNHTDSTGNYIFSPNIDGSKGDVRVYGGVTTFAQGNTYGGNTTVYGGTLMVANTSGSATGSSAVKVQAGGTLGGTGFISKVVTVDGALRPGAISKPGVLTVGGLTLNAGSTVYFRLNEAGNDISTENDRILVKGGLTLNNGTVDAVINAAGRYLLIDYSGALTGLFNPTVVTSTDLDGFTVGGATLDYGTGNKVYLDVAAAGGGATLYWDGASSGSGMSMGAGGAATWDSSTSNWVDGFGTTPSPWGSSVGIFAGTAGIVTIEGAQKFDTLQFLTDGYELNSGALGSLQIEPGGTNTASTINIGRGLTVTINAPIVDGTTGNNKLNIVGGGTVGLLGANTYSGGLLVFRSTVAANSNDSFGTGNIELNTATIRYDSAFDINGSRQITLSGGGGTFDTNVFSSSVNTVVSGAGALYKAGTGTLTLASADTYTGATYVNAGTLALSGPGTIADSAFVQVDAGAVFDIAAAAGAQDIKNLGGGGTVTLGANDLALTNALGAFSGVIQGTGGGFEVKSGIEVLSGVNTYTGVTKISSGSGVLGLQDSGSIASSSEVQIAGGSFDISLTTAGASIRSLSGTGSVGLGSKTLTMTNASGTYGGSIIGSGGLTISGGTQTLSSVNNYTGATQIDAGAQLNLAQTGQVSYSSKVVADGTFDIAATTAGASINSLAGSGAVNLGAQTLTLTNAADTFSGSIAGTGGLTITGGTEVLSGSNTYSGKTTIGVNLTSRTVGTLAAGSANALSAASAYEVQTGGTLDLRGFSQTIASLDNAGIVNVPSSGFGVFVPATLTVSGAYTSNGGSLKLFTNLLTGITDQLDVNSVTLGSGPTAIVVTNKGIGGVATTGSGILLVKTAAAADPTAFKLGARVSAGAYDYTLFYGPSAGTTDPDGWYLRSILRFPPVIYPDYRPEVPVDTVSPALANKMALAMLGTYHERSGAYGKTQNGRTDGVWGRVFGESGDVSYSGSGIDGRFNDFMNHGATYSYDLGGMQIGADLGSANATNGAGQVWGGYFGIGRLDSDVDQVTGGKAGSNEFTAYTVGGYWTYEKEQGAYVEGVVQGMYLDRLKATTLRGQSLETKGMGVSVSLEGGYPFALGRNLVLEPQAQLIYQYTSIKDEADDFGHIDFDASSTVYARVGARIGNKVTPSQGGGKWRYFARLNLWHSVKDNAHATVTDLTRSNPVKFDTSLGGTWAQVGVGMSGSLNDRWSMMGGIDYNHALEHGNKSKGYGLRLGLRYSW